MLTKDNFYYPFLLACISGFLLTLCFPNFNLSIFSWISLVPLLIALEDIELKFSFWAGYLFGAIFTIGSLFWLKVFHPLAMPAMTIVFSCYFGAFSWLYVILKNKFSTYQPVLASIIWISIEYYRSLGFLGFTWNNLGYSQYQNISLIQFIHITGVYGVSFLIIFTNASIAEFILKKKNSLNFLILSITLIIVAFIYGKYFVTENTSFNQENAQKINIKIVQGNFDPMFLDDYKKIDILKNLSNNQTSSDLIVLTETVIMDNVIFNPILNGELESIARQNNSFILIGNISSEIYSDNQTKLFNSAYLFNPQGKEIERYDKIHLVPFGEVFPLSKRFEIVKELESSVDCGGFDAGEKRTVFELKDKTRHAYFAALICYEGVFGDLTREFVKKGANFLVNITNDSWSKSTTSHYQHASISVFRAIENRVYFVRAANTGISFIVDPYGKIKNKLSIYKRGVLQEDIFILPNKHTFYTKYGDIFAWMCVGLTIISMICAFKKGYF